MATDFDKKALAQLEGQLSEQLGHAIPQDLTLNLVTEKPESPKTPESMIMFNVLADFIAIAGSFLSVFGVGFFLKLIGLARWIVNFFWLFGKRSFIRKYIMRRLTFRLFVAIFGEVIPFKNFVYPGSLTIIQVHGTEKKLVKTMWEVADDFQELFGKDVKKISNRSGNVLRSARWKSNATQRQKIKGEQKAIENRKERRPKNIIDFPNTSRQKKTRIAAVQQSLDNVVAFNSTSAKQRRSQSIDLRNTKKVA